MKDRKARVMPYGIPQQAGIHGFVWTAMTNLSFHQDCLALNDWFSPFKLLT
jgi:hypothetical protein